MQILYRGVMMSELVAEPVLGFFNARRFCCQGPFSLVLDFVLDFCPDNIELSMQVISGTSEYRKASRQQPQKK